MPQDVGMALGAVCDKVDSGHKTVISLLSLLIYDLQSEDWINTYHMKGLSKGTQATQSVKLNQMYKRKDDMKYPEYEPEQLCAQG